MSAVIRFTKAWLPGAALALLLVGTPAAAQTGSVSGTVVGADAQPVAGARVVVAGTRLGTLTAQNGSFTIASVPAGAQQLHASAIGYRIAVAPVEVRAGASATVSITLQVAPIEIGGFVVSAARRQQRITEAPATITRLDGPTVENTPGGFQMALKQVTGLDFIQVGITSVAVNARGFNSSFNNRMLMMEDGRLAVLPENGLPVGQFTTMPRIDIAGVEVLVGPGAALYGADASSGVITLQSKDPREFPGTTVEFSGGNREFRNVQARHAGVFGDIGFKVTGEWQEAQDFSNVLKYTAAQLEETGVGGVVDWTSAVRRGQGSLFYYLPEGQIEVSAGQSITDGVGQTNVGRNQLAGWRYGFLQAKASIPNWFFNLYGTRSQAGDSYALNRFTEFRANAANAGKSDEEIRLMSDWPSDGRLFAAEVQNNFNLPALLGTQFVWGTQYRRDIVSSDRQWLEDRLTGEDLEISQLGVYAQTETPLLPRLRLVLAARYDDHEAYDAQFSPKAGLVFQTGADQALRLTYNQAFKSPTTLQTSFYIPDFTPIVAVMGNRRGWTIRDLTSGAVLHQIQPLVPESNQTWEVGYRGVHFDRFFLDASAYYSQYENFLSPLIIIADGLGAGLAGYPAGQRQGAFDADGNQVVNPFGNPLVLTYLNMGAANIYGTDVGLRYFLNPRVTLNGNVSLLRLESTEAPDTPQGREATALNAPTTKWTLGGQLQDFGPFSASGGVRHVTGYDFRSGINAGKIPTFTTLDMAFGYDLPFQGLRVNAGVNNLFTCRTQYANDERSRACGFGERHQEMVNMPEIGTMVFLGMRYQR
jgi:outer membrane receptor for ferrienterochelin and colicins